MPRPALITEADLKRWAKVAKRDGVRIEMEINGKIFRVAPDFPDNHKPATDTIPDDFSLL